jgi:ADP-ribose pyrophosphatase
MRSGVLHEELVARKVLHRGRVFALRVDRVRFRNGRTVTRDIVDHPGAVAILPLLADDRVLLIRQYRHAAGKVLFEVPAGTLEPGEAPESCARRELEEETGYVAQRWQKLLQCYLAPGYSTELIHLFLATRLRATAARPRADERIKVVPVALAKAVAMVQRNQIEDAKTICCLLLHGARSE